MITEIVNASGEALDDLTLYDEAISSPGRMIDVIVTYEDDSGETVVKSGEDIASCEISVDGEKLQTVMRQCTLEIKGIKSLPSGTAINVKMGVYIPSKAEYYYIDYGAFYENTGDDDSGYKNESDTYKAVCYDPMMKTMVTIVSVAGITTLQGLVDTIAATTFMTISTPNMSLAIDASEYEGVTCREILNDIAGLYCGYFVATDKKTIELKHVNATDFVLSCDDLSSLTVTSKGIITGIDYIGSVDKSGTWALAEGTGVTVSIENNVLIRYLVDQSLFNDIKLIYTDYAKYIAGNAVTNYSYKGVVPNRLDIGDGFTIVDMDGNEVVAEMFNQSIKYSTGIEVTGEYSPSFSDPEYSYSTLESKVNQALVQISRANGQLEMSVTKDNLVSTLNMTEEQISLTSNRVYIQSNNFTLETDGTITATSGTIGGWKITDTQIYDDSSGATAYSCGVNKYGVGPAFWAGGTDTTGTDAPFHVFHDGRVYATNAYITGTITGSTITGGTISGADIIVQGSLKFADQSDGFLTKKECFTYSGQNMYANTTFKFGKDWYSESGEIRCGYSDDWNTDYIRSESGKTGAILGQKSYPFQAVFAAAYETTSDRKLKEEITSIQNDEQIFNFIKKLTPVKYKLKNGTGKRTHLGLIAQDVAAVAKETTGDLSLYSAAIKRDDGGESYYDENANDENLCWTLTYTELISPLIAFVQKQDKKIDELEARIAQLEQGGTND